MNEEQKTPENAEVPAITENACATVFLQDDVLICNNKEPLKGNDIAPPVKVGEEYKANKIYTCPAPCGQQHIDVGLKSNYNWVSCHGCGEKLPDGDVIHWSHPSRFNLKK